MASGAACPTLRRYCRRLSQDLFDDMAMHVRQTKVATSLMEREAFVVESQAMQDCRLNVMHVYGSLDDVEAEFVGLTE